MTIERGMTVAALVGADRWRSHPCQSIVSHSTFCVLVGTFPLQNRRHGLPRFGCTYPADRTDLPASTSDFVGAEEARTLADQLTAFLGLMAID
jgi:hypothetical protein